MNDLRLIIQPVKERDWKTLSMWGAIAVLAIVALILAGCAAVSPLPQSATEMAPPPAVSTLQGRAGVVEVHGSAAANITWFDEADRPVTRLDEAGVNPTLTFNAYGYVLPRAYAYALPYGRYRVHVQPFYFDTQVVIGSTCSPICRVRVNLLPYSDSVEVSPRRPEGWFLRVYTGEIPQTTYGNSIGFPRFRFFIY